MGECEIRNEELEVGWGHLTPPVTMAYLACKFCAKLFPDL